jgi:competence protein ComEC
LFWTANLYKVAAGERSKGQRIPRAILEIMTLQLALFFGLLPLTAALFGRVSWLAPFMNLLALPIFNLITVPAALLGLLLSGPLAPLGDWLIYIAWKSVSVLLQAVAFAADIPYAELRIGNLGGLFLVTTSLTKLWAILPSSWPGRKLAWLAALGSLLYESPRPPVGCVEIHTLDVGQGLSTVVQTERHTMVFDTGPSFRSGSDTGALVLVPFLRGKGIRVVDLLVVSHGDNDHAGGVRSLLEAADVRTLIAGEHLPNLQMHQSLCSAGQVFDWDGVLITLLHPGEETIRDGNNASCVVEVRSGDFAALLTGDIELQVERQLVRDGKLPDVELVIVPHHGSRTSSHSGFVAQLKPQAAVISAGHGNRWGFPKDDVVRRWQAAGSEVVNTATFGAISYRMCARSGLRLLEMHRRDSRQIWND